jgi:Peptidase family M1 domain
MKKGLLLGYFLMSLNILLAQNEQKDSLLFNKHDFFLESFNPAAVNAYRSASGMPGPMYWQNNASYLIHATLSEKDTSITGDVIISYTNNSPDKLDYLWLQLDQNLFDPASRGAAATPVSGDRFDVRKFNLGGYHIGLVSVSYAGKTYNVQPVISDTRMQIRLHNPLLPKGDKISVRVNYNFAIPSHGADRLGRMQAKKGEIYEIAQWYPRMCVYDDVEGWNTLPYMGLGEFYCEYGNFDYYITAPSEMIVFGSGDLQNAAEVLTTEEIKRISSASISDKTVSIISQDEIGKPSTRPLVKGNLTWHFTMKNSRDVAWTASKAFVWDAARINLPSGRKAIAMSAYPEESVGDNRYSRGTEYLKNSIEIYSKNYLEYPWNSAVNVGGPVTGMEYPGIIFNEYSAQKAFLWSVITHEIGHNWYPMIVGSNERKYMWQDEGFNTFINYQASQIFNNGEFAKDPMLSRRIFGMLEPAASRRYKDPLMVVPEAMALTDYGQYYGKTAFGLILLRNVILGKERFDYAFRKYTEYWAFKHPTPNDFFHCMNSAAGEDLNWFWKEWFFTTWTLDQALSDVKYVDNDSSKGIFITIENRGKMIMPVSLKIIQTNGDSATVQLPVEIWQRGGIWTLKYASTGKIDKVILDPDKVLPDADRRNNEWLMKDR